MEDQNKNLPYDDFKASVINVLETGHSTWIDRNLQANIMHLDGSSTIVEGYNSVIHTAKGFMIVGVFQDVTQTKYSEISLQRYNNRVEILHKIDKSILAAHSPEQIASSALAGLETLIPNVDFEILQFDLSTRQILYLAKLITKLQIDDYLPMKWEFVEKLYPGEPLFIKEYTEKISLLSMPLQVKGELIGALNLYGDEADFHNPDHLVITQEIADIIAIAIQQSQLQQETQKANIDLLYAYDTTIEGWAKALEMRERETAGHSKRVVHLTLAIAEALEIKAEEMIHIQRGALLHDIGKLGIPDSILLKPGPLTDDEWEIMRQHPFFAYELLSQIPYLSLALDIPYCHHEKWDGSGYPRGLKGEEIPLSARIFAVADVWDALLFKRPYSSGWREEDVIHYIIEKSGTQFDPMVIEAFVRLRIEKFEKYTGIFG